MSGDIAGPHRIDSCPVCGPYVNSEPYRRGQAKALATIPSTVVEELTDGTPSQPSGTTT